MLDFNKIIEACGGASKIAREANIQASAYRYWKREKRVPYKHWGLIIKLSGNKVRFKDLMRLNTRRSIND
jgi:hypothetical protein